MEQEIKQLIDKARAAQEVIEFWPQEKVDEMVAAVGWQLYQKAHAEACAQSAISETGMGVYDHKVLKHMKKTLGVLRDLHGLKTVGVIERDESKGLVKIAKPVGVIGALTPVTNASSTLAANGLPILKTRNAVIFSPHPKAKETCELTCNFMRAGLRQVGAPEDLVLNIKEPTIPLSQDLMKHVDLVVATGGSAMVQAAYSSGTPAYGVGAGNAVVVVDESADLPDAAHKIHLGKVFDNATSCSAENSVVFQESIFDTMVNLLIEEGGYLCNPEEKAALKAVIWPDGTHLSPKVVGQPAGKIADLAGIQSDKEINFLMVIGEAIGPEDMFSAEKLSPVLTIWKYKTFEEAISLVTKITRFSGYGHSCGIHSKNQEHIQELGMRARVSRIMVNQVQTYGNSGNYDNGMPVALTLGCGTWGGNAVSENVHWKHFLNTTWVSSPIPQSIPEESVIFGDHWKKYGE
ncbi:MAG TPA: aldehyde dehydrogenase family protein [Anaerolineaceae bacterium]|nr:aldehyde dehydrogenase family protein [Anaerolineaceae bacterium]